MLALACKKLMVCITLRQPIAEALSIILSIKIGSLVTQCLKYWTYNQNAMSLTQD